MTSVSPHLKNKLYFCLVRSHLSLLFSNLETSSVERHEKVQRRATKYITNDFSSDYRTRLLALHLLPLMYWLELQDLLFAVKSLQIPSDNFNISNLLLVPPRFVI